MMMKWILLLSYPYTLGLVVLLTIGCEQDLPTNYTVVTPTCLEEDLEEVVWEEAGIRWLYGGEADSMHFDISNWSLDPCRLNYGLGRETFQALLSPEYISVAEVAYNEGEKCLVLFDQDTIKVYPYATLGFHEVVNERIDGAPIAVAYCKLADLAVVYDTHICGVDITFAVSGYTYADPNVFDEIPSFILWDRQTESLWWPLDDRGVSGFFKGRDLHKLPQEYWQESTWSEVLVNYPNAVVLGTQYQEVPMGDFRIDPTLIDCF